MEYTEQNCNQTQTHPIVETRYGGSFTKAKVYKSPCVTRCLIPCRCTWSGIRRRSNLGIAGAILKVRSQQCLQIMRDRVQEATTFDERTFRQCNYSFRKEAQIQDVPSLNMWTRSAVWRMTETDVLSPRRGWCRVISTFSRYRVVARRPHQAHEIDE